jgi:hypothetical protein
MKYDLIFHFGYGKAESDWCKLYTNLDTTEVDYLLNQLQNYGEVPLDKIINVGNITLNKTFYIHLDKPREAYLTVCVMESVGLAVHSILDDLNAGLIEFIQEESKVEGFL